VRFGLIWKGLAGLVLIGIMGAVGAITYLNHTRPAALGIASVTPRGSASTSPDDPLNLVCRRPQPGSVAGYRAREQFAELTSPHEAVARTEKVSGWLLIGGSGGTLEIETGCVAVDVRALRSVDELPGFNTSDRDSIARDFLSAHSHPYVIFQPYPASLPLSATSRAIQHVTLAGDIDVSGTTRPEQFALDVRLTGKQVAAAGKTTVQVEDFGVEVPQEAGGFVRVDPHITLEVSLILLKT